MNFEAKHIKRVCKKKERTSHKVHEYYEILTFFFCNEQVITFNGFLNRFTVTYGRLNNAIKKGKSKIIKCGCIQEIVGKKILSLNACSIANTLIL